VALGPTANFGILGRRSSHALIAVGTFCLSRLPNKAVKGGVGLQLGRGVKMFGGGVNLKSDVTSAGV